MQLIQLTEFDTKREMLVNADHILLIIGYPKYSHVYLAGWGSRDVRESLAQIKRQLEATLGH